MKLTGKQRFRTLTRWGKQYIVLQVEEAGLRPDYVGGMIEMVDCRVWRDALLEDLTITDVEIYKP